MKKTTRFVVSAASLAALFCSLAGHAASVTTYADDRAAFLAATGATTIGALPGAPSSPTTANNATIGPVTLHQVGVSTAVFFNYSNEISGNELSTSSVENFDMSLAAGAYSIGFAVHQPKYLGSHSYAIPGA
jgi:hypothetical protein